MLTRSGWGVAAGSIVALVAGRVLGLAELYVFGATGLAIVVVAVLAGLRPLPTVDVDRRVRPPRVPRGGTARVDLVVRNPGPRRTPVLELFDPVEGTVGARVSLAPLASTDRQAAGYRLPTERRGVVRCGPLVVSRTDPFGLARRSRIVAGDASLVVLPAIEPLGGRGPGGGLDDPLAGVAHPVLGGRGDEDFAALRPYVVGDDLRRVHWASSARTGDLLVRLDDPPWRGHLTVVLDGRSDRIDPDDFERAVSAAASLVHAAALRGDRVRLVLPDGRDSGLVEGRLHTDGLLDRLAVVDRGGAGPLPEISPGARARSGGLVVVTGGLDRSELAALGRHPERFASVRVVVIGAGRSEPTGGEAGADLAATDLQVVPVARGTSFAAAWVAADRTRLTVRR